MFCNILHQRFILPRFLLLLALKIKKSFNFLPFIFLFNALCLVYSYLFKPFVLIEITFLVYVFLIYAHLFRNTTRA